MSVLDRTVNMKIKSTGQNITVPYGMVVWSTGVGTRPVVKDFMEQIGQVKTANIDQLIPFNKTIELVHRIIYLSLLNPCSISGEQEDSGYR